MVSEVNQIDWQKDYDPHIIEDIDPKDVEEDLPDACANDDKQIEFEDLFEQGFYIKMNTSFNEQNPIEVFEKDPGYIHGVIQEHCFEHEIEHFENQTSKTFDQLLKERLKKIAGI